MEVLHCPPYSPEEWRAIFASIEALHDYAPCDDRVLEAKAKMFLLLPRAAECYLAELKQDAKPSERRRAALKKWKQIRGCADKLKALLTEAAEQREGEFEDICLTSEREQRIFEGHLDALLSLQLDANRWTLVYEYGLPLDGNFEFSKQTHENPRVMFFFSVLAAWTKMGGKLTFSRQITTGAISGKLATYFEAATRPVMGDRTPSLQTLPDIIERQKQINEWAKTMREKQEWLKRMENESPWDVPAA